jgi:hypothetical protein
VFNQIVLQENFMINNHVLLNTSAASHSINTATYNREPTGIAKARHTKWHKSFIDKSQNELLKLTRKWFHVNSASMVFVQEATDIISVASSDFNQIAFLNDGDFHFCWHIQHWMFENEIQAIIRAGLPIAAWPEEPANEWTYIYATVIEFNDISSLIHFRLRWFDN